MISASAVSEIDHVTYLCTLPIYIRKQHVKKLYTYKTVTYYCKEVLYNNSTSTFSDFELTRLYGNGTLTGNTYINSTDTTIDSTVSLYCNDVKLFTTTTSSGKFNFYGVNDTYEYDIKATPVANYEPKVIGNLKPIITNNSFKFIFYCQQHSKIYKKGINYSIQTVAYDTRGNITYVIDNAPTGITIDNTGVISFNLQVVGTYNFTVNCSDDMLAVTKPIQIQIEIVE